MLVLEGSAQPSSSRRPNNKRRQPPWIPLWRRRIRQRLPSKCDAPALNPDAENKGGDRRVFELTFAPFLSAILSFAQRASGTRADKLAVEQYGLAVDEHVHDARGVLVGIGEGGTVLNAV